MIPFLASGTFLFLHFVGTISLLLQLFGIFTAICTMPIGLPLPTHLPPPLSPRFLHFDVQIQPKWWMESGTRLFAVFESANEGPKSWQMMVQLFANNPDQMMPFSMLWNITKGEKWIKADEMAECQGISNGTKRIQLEVELSPNLIYVRAKNAAKYPLPFALMGSADLRVFFVKIEKMPKVEDAKRIAGCQLNSEIDLKETSRFALPPTTAHPPQSDHLYPLVFSTQKPQKDVSLERPSAAAPDILHENVNQSILNPKMEKEEGNIKPKTLPNDGAAKWPYKLKEEYEKKEEEEAKKNNQTEGINEIGDKPQVNNTILEVNKLENADGKEAKQSTAKSPSNPSSQWQYIRKRIKVPRRSTKAAQRYLGPSHYVPQQNWGRRKSGGLQQQQQQTSRRDGEGGDGAGMFRPSMPSPQPGGWPSWPLGGEEQESTTVAGGRGAGYIDIIRDRQLYEEVQRSRTMEINSRWSSISLLFMGLIASLITLSAAFALVMAVLLQCRPKPKSRGIF